MDNSPKLIAQRFTPQVTLPSNGSSTNEDPSKRGPEEMISETERNLRFKILKKIKQNKKCCDCNAKFPQWGSASFGILVCMNCSGKHRSLGPNVSFVRSIAMDNWKEREMRTMEIGGNKRLKAYLESEMVEGEVDYQDEVLQRYKRMLEEEVEQEMKGRGDANQKEEQKEESQEEEPDQEEKKRKISLKINKEEVEEKKEPKPLEEQKTKVVMAESKQKSGNSESTGGKKGRRRGRNKKIKGKRIAKVDLNQLVTDDLKVQSKGIEKKGLFSETKKTTTEEKEKNEEQEEPLSKNVITKKPLHGVSSENVGNKLKNSKLNKFSGFGSDNLVEESPEAENKIESSSGMGFGVYGGYGSDDLNPKKVKVTGAGNGNLQGKN